MSENQLQHTQLKVHMYKSAAYYNLSFSLFWKVNQP